MKDVHPASKAEHSPPPLPFHGIRLEAVTLGLPFLNFRSVLYSMADGIHFYIAVACPPPTKEGPILTRCDEMIPDEG